MTFAGSFLAPRKSFLCKEHPRHLSFVRNALTGIPTLVQNQIMHNDNVAETTDILYDNLFLSVAVAPK